MEKYVRSVLLKSEEPENTSRDRSDSLVREGTGRFQNVDEALRTFIATEKGLLKAHDF